MRHPTLPRWPTLLVVALMALSPLAASADLCDDCLAGFAGAEGCCPPGCSLCSCCGPGSWTLRPVSWGHAGPADGTSFGDLATQVPSSSPPRDVFHVPKPALA